MSLINLSDAYLHIPINPNSRKYLRFCHKSQVFQFTSLPFGLAPQVFTMIVKEVKLMALTRETKTYSSVSVRGLRIPSRFSPCKTHSREVAKTSGFDPTTQVLTARCLMSLIGLLASTEKMVPEERLHMRPFQFHLKEHWRFPQSLDSFVPWTETILNLSTSRKVLSLFRSTTGPHLW